MALLLSLGSAYALHHFTGWGWAVIPVVVFGTLALVLGLHNYLNPFRRRG
ncbi:MAG: hypothetical protein JJT96_05060 [Opitutales bacterium]|nr:hypothetical protein [Opitutales bacterium]